MGTSKFCAHARVIRGDLFYDRKDQEYGNGGSTMLKYLLRRLDVPP